MRRKERIVVAIIILLAGCSLDYREGLESDELLDTVPDAVLNRFVHTAVKGDKIVFQLEAGQARLFQKKKQTLLSNVRFIEYDDTGAVSIEGRAASALFYTDSENAEISGAIYCYSSQEKTAFYAETLVWEKEKKLLQSQGGEMVRIEKDDGSYIEGVYFRIDARRKTLSFEAAVRGKYIREEEDEENR